MEPTNVFLILVFFIYGLAFFAMGLVVALESRRSSALPLASSLKYLAAFGLLHSVVEWTDMFILIQAQSGNTLDGLPIRPVKLILLALSVLCLLQFAARLIIANSHKHHWLGWVPLTLFVVWLVSFVVPHLYWIPAADAVQAAGSCLQCHRAESAAYLALSDDWVTSADIWARYILYLPGSLLAAMAMLTQKPYFREMRLSRLEQHANWAAVAFAANAFFAGVIVPPGTFFPASELNYASFFAVVSVPPQVFRAAAAMAIAYLILEISSVFEIQQRRQLEKAQRERFEAQQQTLESQREARAQLERWNRELEDKVAQRTNEMEQTNRELAILEERDRIAREMHDSLGQVLGYLGLKIFEIDQLLTMDQQGKAKAELRQMAGAVHDACADVRESILSLRTGIPREGGLVHALEEYIEKFGEQAGLKTEMVIDERVVLRLAPLAEVQLLRIVQEALTNVRKHAQAKHARVSIEASPDTSHRKERIGASNGDTRIVVEDDGRGFDLAEVAQQKGRFGLQTMRERAEEIGAAFEVQTGVGVGTKIVVELATEGTGITGTTE